MPWNRSQWEGPMSFHRNVRAIVSAPGLPSPLSGDIIDLFATKASSAVIQPERSQGVPDSRGSLQSHLWQRSPVVCGLLIPKGRHLGRATGLPVSRARPCAARCGEVHEPAPGERLGCVAEDRVRTGPRGSTV
jgi:hypothetical protein